jgi:hypothetical protein
MTSVARVDPASVDVVSSNMTVPSQEWGPPPVDTVVRARIAAEVEYGSREFVRAEAAK